MKFTRNEKGSITLEAALVMPVFLLFIVFLASMIQIAQAEMVLNHSVSEFTRDVATHVYPVMIIKDGIENYISGHRAFEQLESDYGIGQDQVDVLLLEVLGEDFDPMEMVTDYVLAAAYQNKVEEELDSVYFMNNGEVEVEVDSSMDDSDPFLKVNVAYTMDVPFPFIDRQLILRKQAYERLWIGS